MPSSGDAASRAVRSDRQPSSSRSASPRAATTTTTAATRAAVGAAIESNSDNSGVNLTVGSKNFTEQIILGEIYAQALEAAGYTVQTDLNLGSEQVALEALEAGEISGYPEYTSTALTSFFGLAPEAVPTDVAEAATQARGRVREGRPGDVRAGAVQERERGRAARHEGGRARGRRRSPTSRASPRTWSCSARPSAASAWTAWSGCEDGYGLQFKKFTPVDIEQRYAVLDDGQADLSILFTPDGELVGLGRTT